MDGYCKGVTVISAVVSSVTLSSSFTACSEADVQMKAVKFPKCHLIPADDKLLQNEGLLCGPDQSVGMYGPQVPRLAVLAKPILCDLVDECVNFATAGGMIPNKKNWDKSHGSARSASPPSVRRCLCPATPLTSPKHVASSLWLP